MALKGLEFHERVAEGFRQLPRDDPKRHVLIDARGPVDEVAARVWKAVERVIR
jgi:thymidylate kinase